MKEMNKKGYTIHDLVPIGIAFVVIAVVLGMGATVLNSIQGTQTINSTGWNASQNGLRGLNELSSWLPTIAIIVAAAIIIGIIVVYFAFQRGQ